MSVKLAVFDCDGTLVDGQAAVCDSMEAAFAQGGLPAPDRNAVRRIVGLSLPQAVAMLAPDAERDIREMLLSLRDAGWALAVATGKSDRGLHATIATHGLEGVFDSLQAADRHPSKPHPAMLEAALDECLGTPVDAVMIGDTSFDIAWGYHEPAELLRAGAAAVAEKPADLREILLEG